MSNNVRQRALRTLPAQTCCCALLKQDDVSQGNGMITEALCDSPATLVVIARDEREVLGILTHGRHRVRAQLDVRKARDEMRAAWMAGVYSDNIVGWQHVTRCVKLSGNRGLALAFVTQK